MDQKRAMVYMMTMMGVTLILIMYSKILYILSSAGYSITISQHVWFEFEFF